MPRSRPLRLLLAHALAIGMLALACLGFLALRQASVRGGSEALLIAWVLAFVVGLPALLLVLAAAGARRGRGQGAAILPNAGVNIP